MAAKKRGKPKRAANPAAKQIDALRKTVRDLRVRFEREAKARKIEARLKEEYRRAQAQLSSQLKRLRDEGRKIASDLRTALGKHRTLESARAEAQKKLNSARAEAQKMVAKLRADLAQRSSELRRKSDELRKLAEESARRAVGIIRSEEHHAPGASGAPKPALPAERPAAQVPMEFPAGERKEPGAGS